MERTSCKSCPGEDVLRDLIGGELPEAEQQEVVEHLDGCSGCQQVIEKVATGADSWTHVVEHIDRAQPPSDSAFWNAQRQVENAMAETYVPLTRDTRETALDFLQPANDPAYLGRLDHFDIARVIGRGGMGIVLEGFDTHLRRSVAIKVLDPSLLKNEQARQRFCREARTVASISHEHVVAMHDVSRSDGEGVPYLVMQMINGETLEARLNREGALPVRDILRIGMQMAAGLTAAHMQNLIHRDIKPANVLLESPGGRVKLTDFGLARAAEDIKLTQTGFVTGTPMYMAPEQALGEELDERADLFSLGAVLYQMATGHPPFAGSTALAVLRKITDSQPTPIRELNADIPESLVKLIDQLLSKKPEDRPECTASVAERLAGMLSELGPLSPLQVPSIPMCENEMAQFARTAANPVVPQDVKCANAKRKLIFGLICASLGVVLTLALIVPMLMREPQNSASQGTTPSEPVIEPVAVLSGNAGPVWTVAFTPDASTLAMGIDDGTVKLWDVPGKRIKATIKAHPGPVWAATINRDGTWLATGSDDGRVRIFDVVTTDEVRSFEVSGPIRSMVFSPLGNNVLIGGRTGFVEIWDAGKGEKVTTTKGHAAEVVGVAYSPDGRTIATASGDKTAKLWNAETGAEQLTLSGHAGGVYGIAFSPKGSHVVTGGWDKEVRLWETATGSIAHTCTGHDSDVWCVAYSPTAPLGASVGEDRLVHIWDTNERAHVTKLPGHTGTLYSASFSRDGRYLVTAGRDGTARVWDMQLVK